MRTPLQVLSYAFGISHLLDNETVAVLCLFVKVGKVCVQLARQNQMVEQKRGRFFQVCPVHPSPFPNGAGIPEGFDRLRAMIEEILPSHLDITYVFWYNTWAMMAARHPTWGDGAETGRSWYGLATENDGFEDGER